MPRTGRPRSFDEDETIEHIRDVFWRRGYEATSIQELVAESSVQRASLYATFGDKHALFLCALTRYRRDGLARVQGLADDVPVLPAIRALMLSAVEDTGAPRGCLLAGTVGERVPHDVEATETVREAFADLEGALGAALRAARANGELPDTGDVMAQARMLLAFIEGLQVLAKADADPARLTDTVDVALRALG